MPESERSDNKAPMPKRKQPTRRNRMPGQTGASAKGAPLLQAWPPLALPAPSQGTITQAMFAVPENWQRSLFRKGRNLMEIKDGGTLVGLVSHDGAKLNGPMAVLHPNGRLFILVTQYSKDQKIQGCVKMWDEKGEPLFYSDYRHGVRQGVICYFHDARLRLIQECDRGRPQRQYLVNWMAAGPRILSADELGEHDAEVFRAAVQDLTKLDNVMRKGEDSLKRFLYRNTVGAANQARLGRSLGTIAGRGAAKAAEFAGFWRGP